VTISGEWNTVLIYTVVFLSLNVSPFNNWHSFN
jgi:hypothetical protein